MARIDALKLLVLDFDGVISQSARECFLVTLNAYREIDPAHQLPVEKPLRADDVRGFIESQPELYQRFLSRIPKGTKAADFFSVFLEMSGEADRPRPDPELLREEFYRWRRKLRDADFDAWVRLHEVFPGVPEAINTLAQRVHLAVATAKDRHSILILLESYGLDPFLPPSRVWAQDAAPNKREILQLIIRESEVTPAETLFVDDKVSQLKVVSPLGVRCALAEWGYNGEEEHEEARRLGFDLLSVDDLPRVGS